MAEYIERDKVIDLFDDGKWQGQICIDAVKEIPAADVAQVVHGRWIYDGGNEYVDHYHCDRCGTEIDLCNEIYTEPKPNCCKTAELICARRSTMNSKIIQIIPAPPNMWARWEPTEKGEKWEYSPIVCFALIEDEDGGTYVTPMSIGEDGEIDDVMEFRNFGGVVLPKFGEVNDGN